MKLLKNAFLATVLLTTAFAANADQIDCREDYMAVTKFSAVSEGLAIGVAGSVMIGGAISTGGPAAMGLFSTGIPFVLASGPATIGGTIDYVSYRHVLRILNQAEAGEGKDLNDLFKTLKKDNHFDSIEELSLAIQELNNGIVCKRSISKYEGKDYITVTLSTFKELKTLLTTAETR